MDRKEYIRKYNAENREKIRAQKRANYWLKKRSVRPVERVCATCGRELPIDVFVDCNGRMSTIVDCPNCRNADKKHTNRREYMRMYMRNYNKKKDKQ